MIPYFVLILCPTLIWVCKDKVRLKIGNRVLYQSKSLSMDVFMLIFLFLLAFRGLSCGIDTIQYSRLFDEYHLRSVSELLTDDTHEIGYKLLNKLIGFLFGEYQYLLIVTALLSVCPLWYFYKQESEMPILTMVLFLTVAQFVMYFSGIRQAVAMSMGILAWYTTKNKKLLLFLGSVFLAFLIHTSAFMLLFLYSLYHMKITKKWLWIVIPMMVAVYFFKGVIFDFLYAFVWKEYPDMDSPGAFMILLLLIIFAIYSYIMVDDKSLDRDTIAMRNILLLSVVLQMFAMLHPLAMRMNYYFLIFVPILIPKIAKQCKKQYAFLGRLSVMVMTVYFMFYFFEMVITDNDPLNTFPYIPFWENT